MGGLDSKSQRKEPAAAHGNGSYGVSVRSLIGFFGRSYKVPVRSLEGVLIRFLQGVYRFLQGSS